MTPGPFSILSLAAAFVLLSTAVMAGIAWLRSPRVIVPPPQAPPAGLHGNLLLTQWLARALGALGAGAVLLSGHLGIALPPLWVHRSALAALFAFLLLVQYRQITAAVLCLRRAPLPALALHYRRLWQLTEIAPPPIALLLLASGLRLVAYGVSPRSGWLCLLILSFGLMAFDGILDFTPLTRTLKDESARAALTGDAAPLRSRVLSPPANLQLFCHWASFPVLALCGYFKPYLPNPLDGAIAALERVGGGIFAAVALFLLGGLLAIAANGWQNRPARAAVPR